MRDVVGSNVIYDLRTADARGGAGNGAHGAGSHCGLSDEEESERGGVAVSKARLCLLTYE